MRATTLIGSQAEIACGDFSGQPTYSAALAGKGRDLCRRTAGRLGHARALAERVGFETTNTGEDVTGIPVQRLRPLGHLSDQWLTEYLPKWAANHNARAAGCASRGALRPKLARSRPAGAS